MQHCLATILTLLLLVTARAASADAPRELRLTVGEGHWLTHRAGAEQQMSSRWSSSNAGVAAVYSNGFVIGLTPGATVVRLMTPGTRPAAVYRVEVVAGTDAASTLSSIQEFEDDREFVVKGRRCVGSELNGRMRGAKHENRVPNPNPIASDAPLEWEVIDGAPVVDGIGQEIGYIVDRRRADNGRRVNTAKFNFGMTKVIAGKLHVYAFVIRVKPADRAIAHMQPDSIKNGTVNTSAWLPIDSVVEKEKLLELVGVGEGKLPRLPVGDTKFRITGGDPGFYMTNVGEELSIIKDINFGAHPSDYLLRPSGTVNVLYSVPGFGLGGQSLDSFRASSRVYFSPVKGARSFTIPTYYPPTHPLRGRAADKTMTFLYGAVAAGGSETVYGWVAREALTPATED
jgi:hypothetical protein